MGVEEKLSDRPSHPCQGRVCVDWCSHLNTADSRRLESSQATPARFFVALENPRMKRSAFSVFQLCDGFPFMCMGMIGKERYTWSDGKWNNNDYYFEVFRFPSDNV